MELVEWIGAYMHMPSPSPLFDPWNDTPDIDVFSLLDMIHQITGIPEDTLGEALEKGRTDET